MSQEATASSPLSANLLVIKKKEDNSIRVLIDGNLLNHNTQRLPRNLRTADKQEIAPKFPTDSQPATAKAMSDKATLRPRLTTAEKDEIAREVSAISDRAAARIMDDDDDEFQRYVEATAKYGRTPTGLKFDHYSNTDFFIGSLRIHRRLQANLGHRAHEKPRRPIDRASSHRRAFKVHIAQIRRSSKHSHRSH